MNDTMSLLLATVILTAGGLGFYVYKSSNDEQNGGNDEVEYNEDDFFNFNDSDEIIEDESEVYEPKVVRTRGEKSKTKRNKKTGGTKRRY